MCAFVIHFCVNADILFIGCAYVPYVFELRIVRLDLEHSDSHIHYTSFHSYSKRLFFFFLRGVFGGLIKLLTSNESNESN